MENDKKLAYKEVCQIDDTRIVKIVPKDNDFYAIARTANGSIIIPKSPRKRR